jgi:hypothetical protein
MKTMARNVQRSLAAVVLAGTLSGMGLGATGAHADGDAPEYVEVLPQITVRVQSDGTVLHVTGAHFHPAAQIGVVVTDRDTGAVVTEVATTASSRCPNFRPCSVWQLGQFSATTQPVTVPCGGEVVNVYAFDRKRFVRSNTVQVTLQAGSMLQRLLSPGAQCGGPTLHA